MHACMNGVVGYLCAHIRLNRAERPPGQVAMKHAPELVPRIELRTCWTEAQRAATELHFTVATHQSRYEMLGIREKGTIRTIDDRLNLWTCQDGSNLTCATCFWTISWNICTLKNVLPRNKCYLMTWERKGKYRQPDKPIINRRSPWTKYQ